MEEDIENDGGKRLGDHEPNIYLFERAYANSLVPKVMDANTRQGEEKLMKHNQAIFRASVLEHYGALDQNIAWCHVPCHWLLAFKGGTSCA